MPRPRLYRKIRCRIKSDFFKPNGIEMKKLDVIEISKEELEALRLKNIKNFNQIESAKQMKTSQSTFQRILDSAYKKVSDAIVNGKAIRINK